MNREKLVDMVGESLVAELDKTNAELNGYRDIHHEQYEFLANISLYGSAMTAVYYQDACNVDGREDLSDLTWTVDHYRYDGRA